MEEEVLTILQERNHPRNWNELGSEMRPKQTGVLKNEPIYEHFPGDGVDERDQHLLSTINSLSVDDWMNSYGQIYQTFIDQGISSIMIGHIMLPAWEKQLSPDIKDSELRPASASKRLIDGLLRDELGFNGLTITDATPMTARPSSKIS